MVAVISGNGLGLFNSSLNQLGYGHGGNARLGQGATSQYVNVANGNLLLQSKDEQLIYRGVSVAHLRTYNSQGTTAQMGSDGWLTGFERRVELVGGTQNAARIHTADGSFQNFTFVSGDGNFDTYASTSGDGAHDSLVWSKNAQTWTFVEGSSRRQEIYANHADPSLAGRLTLITDLKSDGVTPVSWEVIYGPNGNITAVRSQDTGAGIGADSIVFTRDANGRVSRINTVENSVIRAQVNYEYDSVGRLTTVLVDLTPLDGAGDRETWDSSNAANNDGYLYRTTYAYADASSLRIASVRQSDGTVASFTYQPDGRIATFTTGDVNTNDADGLGHTVTFAYDTANRTTHVSDSAGRTWSYLHDATGQLTEVQAPAVNGLRDRTSYTYDSAGNLTRTQTLRGTGVVSQTDYKYDTSGNVVWEWRTVDPASGAAATAISRTYTATNQLALETVYTGLDADGAAAGQAPTGGLNTRYVYDAQNRVRFVINPAGEVREIEYASSGNAIGQAIRQRQYLGDSYTGGYTLAALTSWATTARKADSTLVESGYDLKGRLSQTKHFASVDSTGAGIENDAAEIYNYVYDAQGLLRQKVAMRSSTEAANDGRDTQEAVSYTYDGMGRLLSEVVTKQIGTGSVNVLRATTWAYQDSGNAIRVIVEGGIANDGIASNDLLRTEVRNSSGQVIAITESALTGGTSRVSQNYYDEAGLLRASQDAAGGRTYFFYDNAGRLSGFVDEVGAVTAYDRDAEGRVTQTRSYASHVNTSAWLNGGDVVPETIGSILPGTSAHDRTVVTVYDGLGRVLREIDAEGGIKRHEYDGAGRLLKTTATDALGTALTARTSRLFYDTVGRLTGTLDAEGYLSEFRYDRAGRKIQDIAYATATSPSLRANGTLAQLRPQSNAQDQLSRSFYDGHGNLIAFLNAEGYLTEFVYDQARNQRAVSAYATQVTGLSGTETLSYLRSQVQTGQVRETRRLFDALGRLSVEVNHEGTATRYTYDAQGRLLRTESNYTSTTTSEIRENYRRYDVFGNLVGELSGDGAAQISESQLTEAEIDALYVAYGIRHAYDALNRRIESIDAEGNHTWYFYDSAGQQTHVVRGVADAQGVKNALGEVIETRYTAFGQVRDTTAFTGRIALAVPGSRTSAADAISVLAYVAESDSRTQLGYDRRGLLTRRIDAEGALTTFGYNAFADNNLVIQQIDDTRVTKTIKLHDNRGLLTQETADADGLAKLIAWEHDAFGRVVSATDANDKETTYTFDRLGRQVSTSRTVSGRLEQSVITYDAYARVVTLTNATGDTTTYAYDDDNRSFTITTQEGVVVTTVHNAFGEKVRVVDGFQNSWSYQYDLDGRLVSTEDPEGDSTSSSYNARGLLVLQTDGSGRQIAYEYDAAGRVLRKIEDPNDLMLVTQFAYDGQGRQVSITDATGRRTTMHYDLQGRLLETVRDPDGLNLRTTYAWDDRGLQLSVTEGAGTVNARTVAYGYDGLGRRITETVAPGTLNYTTTYGYDANGNLTSRIDPENRITRYVYDEDGRQLFSVDGFGGVARTWYDAAGRVVATRAYAQKISIAGLPNQVDASAILPLLTADDARDVQRYTLYDGDGRVHFSIDGAGAVQTRYYDAAGRLTETTRYANAITVGAGLRSQLIAGTAEDTQIQALIAADVARDNVSWLSYDNAGRVRYTVDAHGALTASDYDGAGRVTETLSYGGFLDLDVGYPVGSGWPPVYKTGRQILREGLSSDQLMPRFQYTSDWAPIRSTAFIYDQAGRLTYSVQTTTIVSAASGSYPDYARGAVHAYRYDAAGRVTAEIDYGNAIQLPTYAPAVANAGAQSEWTVEEITQALLSTLEGSGETLDDVPQRVTRYAYDGAGRQRFSIDAAGAISEQRFNSAGEMTEVRNYGNFFPNAAESEVALVALLQGESDYRATSYLYNEAGRLSVKTDGLGKSETYIYDGAGLLTSYTNRDSHTWTYAYDAAGRRILEVSPQVAVAAVDAAGNISSTIRSILTRTAYDGLGNVISRTEDADTVGARTTLYGYDNRGHQVRTTFPDAGLLNEAGQVVASGTTATVEVVYDALGKAVVQKDVRGYYSYNIYDGRGHLAFEIDASGHVTGYTYNGHGDQVTLRRYAAAVPAGNGSPITIGQIDGLLTVDDLQDRVITTVYDNRGNKMEVSQNRWVEYQEGSRYLTDGPKTIFTYNAYGELVREAKRLDVDYSSGYYDGYLGYGPWAITYHFYDQAGQRTQTVDPEGYVTAWSHTAHGEVKGQIEYARAIEVTHYQIPSSPLPLPLEGDASTGYDRIMRWTYDALGRKASETSVRRYQQDSGQQAVRDVLTTIQYDNEGHATQVTVDGQSTVTRYDAIGRSISIQESARNILRADVAAQLEANASIRLSDAALYVQSSPYTTTAYDAFGNVVKLHRYANGLREGEASAVASADDAVHLSRYDWQGRNVWEKDAAGTVYVKQFDAADNLLHTSYRLDGNDGRWAQVRMVNTYDASGRLTTSVMKRDQYDGIAANGTRTDRSERVVYNSFGEIIAKDHRLDPQLAAQDMAAQFYYDQGGNLIRTNAQDGMWRDYGYDLAGNQVSESHQVRVGQNVIEVETRNEVDLNGRLIKQYLPQHTDDIMQPASTIERTFDRWGNVIQVIDPRGAHTNYEYNALNQVVREIRPEVKVVHANGTESMDRPELAWFYDAMGRLVGSRDANGNTRKNAYDQAGRLISAQDGTTAVSRMAYDAFGQQELTQDALGYVVFREFDRAGRITAQGDYLTDQAGVTRTRTLREQYSLNQNGDRLSVTNGLLQSSYYDYDSRGKVILSRTAAGVEMRYAYDSNGNKTRETNGLFDPNSAPVTPPLIATPVPIPNPGFESGASGWDLLGADGATVQVVSSGAYSGSGVLRMIGTGESQDGSAFMNTAAPVSAGQSITASARMRISSGTDGTSYSLVFIWYDANGTEISRSGQDKQELHNIGSGWRQNSFAAVAPAGAASVKVGFYFNASNSGTPSEMYVDDVSWNLTTLVPSDGEGEQVYLHEQTWDYDYFNRLIDHNDLSGADYDYEYDPATGQLIRQSNDWAISQDPDLPTPNGTTGDRELIYYANGRIKEIREATIGGTNWTRYAYDASGNRTVEETYTRDALGAIKHLRSTITYDSHSRVTRLVQDDVAVGRRLVDVRYGYDAMGNRRVVEAGTSYNPNGTPPPNATFESGDTGWSLGTGWTIVDNDSGGDSHAGQWSARFEGSSPASITNNERVAVVPGQVINASVMVQQGASDREEAAARVLIVWYDADGNPLPGGEGRTYTGGTIVNGGAVGEWRKSEVTATVPPGAAFMALAANATDASPAQPLFIDDFSWSYRPADVETGGGTDPNGPINLNFDAGDDGWTLIAMQADSGNMRFSYNGGQAGSFVSENAISVQAGENFSAAVQIRLTSRVDQVGGGMRVNWYDAGGNFIGSTPGNQVNAYWGGGYPNVATSSVNTRVPEGAVYARLQGEAFALRPGADVVFDNFTYSTRNDGEVPITQRYWYTYDGENRVTVANGKLQNGQIVLGNGDESYALSYDGAGNAFQRRFLDGGVVMQAVTQYDQRGQRSHVFEAQALGSGTPVQLAETFEYDAAGRQTRHRTYDETGLRHLDRLVFDADGRILKQTSFGRSANGSGYDPGDFPEEGLALLSQVDYSTDAGYGYDAAGRLRGYEYSAARHEAGTVTSGPIGFAHDYVYQYEGRDGYLETQVNGTSSNPNFKASTSESRYDAWGRRVAVRENTPGQSAVEDRVRYFSYDLEGHILHRREGTLVDGALNQDAAAVGQTQLYAYASGQQVASGKYNGELDIIGRLTAYDTSEIGTVRMTVQAGDTLRSIAQRAYGNANLWYVIAEANAIADDSQLTAGTTVTIPEVKVASNDAGTFKPFNPAEAIGDTAPSLPYITPPPKQHCNALATILIVVVAVIVTVYTAGAAAGALGATGTATAGSAAGTAAVGSAALAGGGSLTVAAGATLTAGQIAAASAAIGGFAGSVAAQAVGSALGQTSFSWRDALVSGAVSGATAGFGAAANAGTFGSTLQGASWARAGGQAVAGQLTSYAASRAFGVDTSFSWRNIAASAVSAAVTANIGGVPVTQGGTSTGSLINDFGGQFVRGGLQATTQRLFGNGRQDWGQVAADAFGNALGNATVRGIETLALRRQTNLMLEQMSPEQRQQLLMMNFNDPNASTDRTREASDEALYASQADIDALKAQGRDVTVAQQALDELWTRRYAGDDIPTLETVTAVYEENAELDAMGQPLNGRSNYDAFSRIGEIWNSDDGVMDKMSQTWSWANYTVPDREQRLAERMAQENEFWRVDQMRTTAIGSAAYVISGLFGANQSTQDAWLATGSNLEAILPGSSSGGIRPASTRRPRILPSNGPVTNTINRSDLGDLLGRGGNKDVFAYGDSYAVGVLRAGKNPAIISEELSLLRQLDDLALPTVNVRGPVLVNGQHALVFDRFAQGSKDVVRLQDGRIRVVGDSPFLNQQSISDLQGIRQTMVGNNIRINDLQFLIGRDGRVVVADPLGVQVGVAPSKNNLRTIDLLIQQAQQGGR